MRAGIATAFLIAALLTLAIAWPVVLSPSEQIYGHEIVGRHYDAYLVMAQIGGASTTGVFAQPVTDRMGWLFAHVMSPVAAYNLLVLLSFPLTAAATYALARRLTQSGLAAMVAALMFTIAPLRLAHAAYHPHIVQTQWIALYLLALWSLMERSSWTRAAAVAVASAALVFSNFYAGLMGAVLTPVALFGWWLTLPDARRRASALVFGAGTMAVIAAAGIAFIAWNPQLRSPAASMLAFPLDDVGRYSARWWAYFVPAVDHPLFGAHSSRVFAAAGETVSLVEEQVFVSFALLVLASIGTGTAIARWRTEPRWRPVVAMMVIGVFACVVSIGPISGHCAPSSWAPACAIHRVLPMFRSYARFALVVHLAIAVAAGAGVAVLVRRSRVGRVAAALLVMVAAGEYAPLPWRAHDVLPTRAHRWMTTQPASTQIFDCGLEGIANGEVSALMHRRVTFAKDDAACREPELAVRLAALKYTHVIERVGPQGPLLLGTPGVALVASFPDSRVYRLAPPPSIVTIASSGFFELERGGGESWRWMTASGQWTVRNTTSKTQRVMLVLRLSSPRVARTLLVALDDQPVYRLHVGVNAAEGAAGPLSFAPGDHVVAFMAIGAPYRPADDGHSSDTRALSIMFRSTEWRAAE